MTSCLEYRAKTVKKAVEKACRELKISNQRLVYDVICDDPTGFLGLVGLKKAKIRVSVPGNGTGDVTENSQGGPGENGLSERRWGRGDRETGGGAEGICREALERVTRVIDPTAEIRVAVTGGWVRADVRGGDSALMIGKHGQTLEAIQYLVEKMVNKRMGQRVRLQVDVEGYLANRRESLRRQAGRQAGKVHRSGKPASMGQLNSNDRRIVHMSLKDDRRVRTQSIGEGAIRKLLILPKRSGTRQNRGRDE